MAGPMSCEQREESRHTDWLYFFSLFSLFLFKRGPAVVVVWCRTIQNVSCLDFPSVGCASDQFFFSPDPTRSWAGWLRKANSIFFLAPPLVTYPFSPIRTSLCPLFLLQRLWSPSNGMIVVADVRHLSWWSCVREGGRKGETSESEEWARGWVGEGKVMVGVMCRREGIRRGKEWEKRS